MSSGDFVQRDAPDDRDEEGEREKEDAEDREDAKEIDSADEEVKRDAESPGSEYDENRYNDFSALGKEARVELHSGFQHGAGAHVALRALFAIHDEWHVAGHEDDQ